MRLSVVICTWQPGIELLKRVLRAVAAQTQVPHEIILVDNNSSPPVLKQLGNFPADHIRFISEPNQGLVHARLSGAAAATGDFLVFVDDDNILAPDYLRHLAQLVAEHPGVAVWGPGHVDVEFEGTPPAWLVRHFGTFYQEKKQDRVRTGKERGWPAYYPAGSGMAVRRDVMTNYATLFSEGKLTATGRTAKQLSSAEDAQIVWTAVKSGFSVGTAPQLRLVHVIPREKQSAAYLCRLQAGIGESYYRALTEMFPEMRSTIRPLGFLGRLRLLVTRWGQHPLRPVLAWRLFRVDAAWFKGLKRFLNNGTAG